MEHFWPVFSWPVTRVQHVEVETCCRDKNEVSQVIIELGSVASSTGKFTISPDMPVRICKNLTIVCSCEENSKENISIDRLELTEELKNLRLRTYIR